MREMKLINVSKFVSSGHGSPQNKFAYCDHGLSTDDNDLSNALT